MWQESKHEPRQTKDFKAKYHKVKAKLALIGLSTLTSSSSSGKNKGLIVETYDWDDEEVSSDENEVTKVKALMALVDEERVLVGKESDRNDTDDVPLNESQRNTTDPSIVVSNSSTTDYGSADESLVCSTPLLSLKKLDGAEPISGPKTIKSILKSKSTFKYETLKGITINDHPQLLLEEKVLQLPRLIQLLLINVEAILRVEAKHTPRLSFAASRNALWSRFIRAVHGNSGGIEMRSRVSYSSTWLTIVNEINNLRNKVASKMIHNDVGFSLRRQPRDGVEMEQFRVLTTTVEAHRWRLIGLVDLVLQHWLHDMIDRWKWSLEGSGEFSVASARKLIDDNRLLGPPQKTRWLKEVESTNHIFFAYSLARDIYRKIASWWELTYYEFQDYEEWLAWIFSLRTSSKQKELLEEIYYVTWWLVWNHRNKSIFDSRSPSKAIIFDDLVSRSFYWCRYRCKARFSWLE
nr:RNA-directed DNA polymerase, eukaryota [Tanacetum cinerariifolium]